MIAAETQRERQQRDAGGKLERRDRDVPQEIIVEHPLREIAQVLAGEFRQDPRDLQAAGRAVVNGVHRHVDHDRAQRVQAKQHVRLEKVAPADLLEGKVSQHARMDRRIAVGRVGNVPVARGELRQDQVASGFSRTRGDFRWQND